MSPRDSHEDVFDSGNADISTEAGAEQPIQAVQEAQAAGGMRVVVGSMNPKKGKRATRQPRNAGV